MAKYDYLKYDTEQMASTKRIYNECVTEMDSLRVKMQNMVDSVKEGWKSEAGDAFFTKYDNEWLQGFTQYQEVLTHMAENLDSASGKYSEITLQAKALKIR